MNFLKDHPFAVEAFFESSLVLTFALPQEQLQKFIPACLQLDTFQDKWAFLAVAMVQTNGLRPKGFPNFLGSDFFLIGYRIFVRYTNIHGKRLRGLYIIKSETNKKTMQYAGNFFTHYNYTTTDIAQENENNTKTIASLKSNFSLTVEQTTETIALPFNSPFSDWKEARKFAGPLPFTFTYNEKDKTVLIIEGVRENWEPQPIRVKEYHFGLFEDLSIENPVLANAFEIKNVPYWWKKGKKEKWI
jgi:hypothetical protein